MNSKKTIAFLFALQLFAYANGLKAQTDITNLINDSTIVRYRYELEEHLFAEVPAGQNFKDLDLSEKDRLKAIHQKLKICEGINSQNERFFQIEAVQVEHLEDWMSTPTWRLVTPRGSYGYKSSGELDYYFPFSAAELQTAQSQTSNTDNIGYFPILTFFPNKRQAFVQDLITNGFHFNSLAQNSFKLSKGQEVFVFDPENKVISHNYEIDSVAYQKTTHYTLYAPYGYVPIWEVEKSTRTDISNPITFVERRFYSNHVIEDLNAIVKKYTDESHVEIYPNPVSDSYEVALMGVPDAQVGFIQIRDHMGNIVATHNSPTVEGDIISLQANNYPNGVLILIISTQYGIYTTTFTKI